MATEEMNDLSFLLCGRLRGSCSSVGSRHQLSHLAPPSGFHTLAWHAVNAAAAAAGQLCRHFLPRGNAARPQSCKDFPTLRIFVFTPESTEEMSLSDSRTPFMWAEPSFEDFSNRV